VEFEWYKNTTFVNFRDSKNPGVTRLLPVPSYMALLQGIKGLEGEFDYQENHLNFNNSGIDLVSKGEGITVSFKRWSSSSWVNWINRVNWIQSIRTVSFWFNRAEWDKFIQAVRNGEYELDKLREDFYNKKESSAR
jgi:hypothetical protein